MAESGSKSYSTDAYQVRSLFSVLFVTLVAFFHLTGFFHDQVDRVMQC